MENIVLILFLVGIICAILEVFITGFGFFGITSVSCFVLSLILTYFTEQAVLLYTIEFVGLVIMCGVLWYLIKRFKLLRKLVNDETVNMEVPEEKNHLIGQVGVTKSVLKPVGFLTLEDKTMEAIAVLGFIEKDEKVRIVRVTDGKLFVEKV